MDGCGWRQRRERSQNMRCRHRFRVHFCEGMERDEIYEAPMHGAADDRGDYFSAPEEMEGDSAVGQKCTVRRTRSPING